MLARMSISLTGILMEILCEIKKLFSTNLSNTKNMYTDTTIIGIHNTEKIYFF